MCFRLLDIVSSDLTNSADLPIRTGESKFSLPGHFSAFLHYEFEALFNENLMFEYNLNSSKTISICHRKISFVPKRILRGPTTDFFSVSRYRDGILC